MMKFEYINSHFILEVIGLALHYTSIFQPFSYRGPHSNQS